MVLEKEKFHAANKKAQHALMRRPIYFSFGGGQKRGYFFFTCSQCVPIMFESDSPSSQVVLQDIPNITSYLIHMVCQQFNSHVYKLKR
jgi:hypothetical protein